MDLLTHSVARFSDDRVYRYRLLRRWAGEKFALGFIMLNPSTADEFANDPTIERCMRRAEAMGAGSIIVLNAYALRSTDPAGLWKVADPVGPDNDAVIAETLPSLGMIVCGWGKNAKPGRIAQLRTLLAPHSDRVTALAVNADGSPQHPLYIPYDAEPKPFLFQMEATR